MTDKTNSEILTSDPTPLSSMMNWPLLSNRKSNVELKTDDPTPLSSQMNWPLIGGRGEGNVELTTNDPTPFSRMMNWPLLSDKATMFDTEVGSTSSENKGGGFSAFMRSIMTGEPQK
ncbi:hypothetical protein [Rhodovulum adriaticum]|uniref:Uncharacterized protein n=1 Tax=Rhodovulum adriaticum TaxID=35804 RepID=A0A4R2NLN3_RHOAD|nr:hypothetical protein [Rhodovulum adriaticum]MBK1636035.1 hypothetical protein [Rhodovulum adriaticum]TCP22467.1 hypothetical protein EV656_10653 [Rhodovulum adriaticum]